MRPFNARWVAALALLALACSGSSPEPKTPEAALSGDVIARADGFASRPGWAEPGQAWGRNGDSLVVVGHARVPGAEREEMALQVSDSYARAELLRFLTVRVTAVLLDAEASGTAASGERSGELSEEAQTAIEERITSRAEATIDDWFIGARYWEKREDDGKAYLHAFSRMEVPREQVATLLTAATEGATDLRLSGAELAARLGERWDRIADVDQLAELEADGIGDPSAPEWASSGDSQSTEGFTFVCRGRADDEGQAKTLAEARCNEKLCRLFGVKISARTTVVETLEGMDASSEVSEQCAEVRVVGRKLLGKSSECTGEGCTFWLKQSYPRSAYDAEVERQKQPTVIRQEVVIQEGSKRYRDPVECEASLRRYSVVEGVDAAAYQARAKHLTRALEVCQDIDPRDSGLFMSLNLLLTKPLATFVFPEGRSSAEGAGEVGLRSLFAAVPADWMGRIETERFLTSRIQAVRAVVADAVFPMQLIDGTRSAPGGPVSDEAYEALVKKAIASTPFDATVASEWHRHSVHAILIGLGYYGYRRYSPTYRAYLLEQLARADISCGAPTPFNANAISNYLGFLWADSDTKKQWGPGIDETAYRALLKAYRRAPAKEMESCIDSLLDQTQLEPGVLLRRGRELAELAANRKLAIQEHDLTTSKDNQALFQRAIRNLDHKERLALYLKYRASLVKAGHAYGNLAESITVESFGGLKIGPYDRGERERAPEQIYEECVTLAARFRAAHEEAPELPIEETDTCECLHFTDFDQATRRGLVDLWTSVTDRECKYFTDSEWPGGMMVWPYPKRDWRQPKGTPFRHDTSFLEKEYRTCANEAGIESLDYTPRLRATLRDRRLGGVTISTHIDGNLRRMTKSKDRRALVRKEDVMKAKETFDACFLKAAEGYEVPVDQFESTPPRSARRMFVEFGDQGTLTGWE